MKMGLLKFSKEIKHLIYVIIVLSIVFAFNDGSGSFVFSNWLNNFLSTLILVTVVVLTFFVGIKVASKLLNYDTEFCIWKLKYAGFSRESKFPYNVKLFDTVLFRVYLFPHIGTIIALVLTLISNGGLFFTAIFTFLAKEKRKIGKDRVYLKGSTELSITLISIVFILVLIMLFKILNIEKGLLIGSWFLIWNLIPIGPLLGSKIFFSSRTLYFGTLIFTILFLSIVSVMPLFVGLLITTLFSVIAMIVYFWKFECK
ncbi:MAG: hypothetical protein ISS82_03215 [Nanoarchaeota archaeon]|nr:hypothetical protein [Nanoarchaeota archaeon]